MCIGDEIWDNPDTGLKPSRAKEIGILCEFDALADIGHGCGHNLIAELGVAAGVGLKWNRLTCEEQWWF